MNFEDYINVGSSVHEASPKEQVYVVMANNT
jgi:hypothetical protein